MIEKDGDVVFSYEDEEGAEIKCIIKAETIGSQRKADMEYHQVYVEALRRGIPPRSVLEKILYDQGMWTKDDDESMRQMQVQIALLEQALKDSKTDELATGVANSLASMRHDMLSVIQRRGEVLNNSAEFVAEQARRDALIAYSTYYAATNQLVYQSYMDFLKRENEPVTTAARSAITKKLLEALGSYVDGLPEAQYAEFRDGDIANAIDGLTEAREQVKQEMPKTTSPKKKTTSRKKTTRKPPTK